MKIPKLTIVIFIASMSVLMYELALVRIFSVSFLTNTAFVAISIALFGLVAGGLIVYSKAGYFSVDRAKERIGVFFFFYCISLFFFPLIFLRLNLSNDNGLVIGVAFFLAAVPFENGAHTEPLAVIYRKDQKLTPVMENFIAMLKQPVEVAN